MYKYVLGMALCFVGCNDNSNAPSLETTQSQSSSTLIISSSSDEISSSSSKASVIANGNSVDLNQINLHFNFSFEPQYGYGVQANQVNSALIINDYWALAQEPSLTLKIQLYGDTLHILYQAKEFGIVKDWTPTVKFDIMYILAGLQVNHVLFKAVPFARAPTKNEPGFRNAQKDTLVQVGTFSE